MPLLIAITLLWAFSFSLIGEYLVGHVDGYLVVLIRMLLAAATLLPFTRWRQLIRQPRTSAALVAIGAIQIGVMYILLYQAFLYLSVAEVLLFTIFTPIYITIIDELCLNRRHLPLSWWLAASLAVLGAAILRYQPLSSDFVSGFLLIQGANFCFAAGQVAYKRLPLGSNLQQRQQFLAFFVGAIIVSGIGALLFGNWQQTPHSAVQWGILLWLGIVASGLGYLGWNIATKWVNTGQLATMNNALIPAGILVNMVFWRHPQPWGRFFLGSVIIIAAVWLAGRVRRLSQA
ncbi:EamA family transporter [Idiomarina tyrosinivorans]|uniref:EamA family transporter n=1 Tax=Idiomarina tyrosinivorans TaxID=1445662 RepID=A0A432ZRP7_9GAMM|nr:EamA family transporter [Idiomarina tyrosinivorans]RUO80532.1 EamA family transporter [Idiomarina tyrosinivorans]